MRRRVRTAKRTARRERRWRERTAGEREWNRQRERELRETMGEPRRWRLNIASTRPNPWGSRHRRRYGRHYRCVYHQCVFPTLRSTGLVWPTDRRIHMCELLTPTRPARMRAHINKQHINLDPLASHLSPVSGALVWLGVRGGAGNGPSVVGRAERGGGRDQKEGGETEEERKRKKHKRVSQQSNHLSPRHSTTKPDTGVQVGWVSLRALPGACSG
jgi:hypothetical protein